jgi:uncharacterized protein with HEPN domain
MDRNYKAIAKIKAHIDRLLGFAAGRTFNDFCADYMLYDAIVLNLLQIGEQATNLDDGFCAIHMRESVSIYESADE